MKAVLAQTANIAIIVFAASSMLAVGLAYRLGRILGPLRQSRAVFRALVANFILVPLLAGILLVLGAFAGGYLLSRRERSAVLGLGTAQRNIAGAMVIASRDFTDPDILVMITASFLAGLLVLFPIAWLLGRHSPHVGLPTSAAPT